MNINTIDQKLIIELQKNGRISYAKLARLLRINTSTIKKRVDRLLKENIITIQAAPNPFNMGHVANAFITLDVDLTKIDTVCAQVAKNFNISLVITVFGRFDVLLIADYSTWERLTDFIKLELPKIEGIHQVETFFVKEYKKRFQDMFAMEETKEILPVIDEVDINLIKELMEDGRYSCVYLADKLGISLSMVSRRVSSLVKKKIISIKALPNPSMLGYSADAFIVLKTDATKVNDICSNLSNYREVHLIATLVNGYDILLGVHFPSPETLYEFIKKKIAFTSGVLNIETFIRAEIIKRYYGFFFHRI
jgi:Lrp/AsnC family transcriptional regulator for asnA, asnC and gidA